MKPQEQFCPNLDCPARGQVGVGNITIHSRKEQRYACKACGNALYRLKKETQLFTLVMTLLVYGCPVQAIVVAFGLDERTVRLWLTRAGEHSQKVYQYVVQQGQLEGQHIQVDEIWVKLVNGVQWMALSVLVGPQLWLGGAG